MDYRHMSDTEIRSYVENFGTDNEKILLELFGPVQECFNCDVLVENLSDAQYELADKQEKILRYLDEFSSDDAIKLIRKECGDDG